MTNRLFKTSLFFFTLHFTLLFSNSPTFAAIPVSNPQKQMEDYRQCMHSTLFTYLTPALHKKLKSHSSGMTYWNDYHYETPFWGSDYASVNEVLTLTKPFRIHANWNGTAIKDQPKNGRPAQSFSSQSIHGYESVIITQHFNETTGEYVGVDCHVNFIKAYRENSNSTFFERETSYDGTEYRSI